MRIEWSPDAVSDLKSISEYVEQDRSLETANKVARLIYDSIQSLRTMPHRGRKGRVESTRELVVSSLPYIYCRLSRVHGASVDSQHRARGAKMALVPSYGCLRMQASATRRRLVVLTWTSNSRFPPVLIVVGYPPSVWPIDGS